MVSRPRWRLWLAQRVYPWWTESEVDAIKWRAEQHWLELGFGVKHDVDTPCPAPVLADYRIGPVDWASPPDVVALEHHYGGENPCLVASSTMLQSLPAVLEAAIRHQRHCPYAR